MKTISGFTFVHNAISSGYPIVEAIKAVQPCVDEVVVVDMQSTDDTRDILESLNEQSSDDINFADIRIIDGVWDCRAGETLKAAHSLYKECSGDVIVHFEADEVYSESLIQKIIAHIYASNLDSCFLSVHRLQLEQNFQRCRWYPKPAHRVWPKSADVIKDGETTEAHDQTFVLGPQNGFLWDITNCFRNNWMNRIYKQAEMRNEEPQYLMALDHINKGVITDKEQAIEALTLPHWTWNTTPFDIPEVLKPLVGITRYDPEDTLNIREIIAGGEEQWR